MLVTLVSTLMLVPLVSQPLRESQIVQGNLFNTLMFLSHHVQRLKLLQIKVYSLTFAPFGCISTCNCSSTYTYSVLQLPALSERKSMSDMVTAKAAASSCARAHADALSHAFYLQAVLRVPSVYVHAPSHEVHL